MIPLQKIIAWFLIGLLCFEVTFRVPFLLPDASALESANHEDVVSLLVEEELFRKMSSDIDAYARRIQNKLARTRTVILTYSRDTHPYLIASANERLYFSGVPNHGNKTQKLVGTILIGHVPLPVVHKNNKDFLSLYPYTDFEEPHFFWNWDTSRYEYLNQKKDDPRPDIWHSVIDPNTGNIDTDVQKIREFFTRVYEFDEKKGRYQNVGVDPQVLYMDSVNESRAASKGLLAVYEQIFVPQQEHLLYHRFTKEFAQYLYAGFLVLMKSEGTAKITTFRDWKPDANSSSSFLSQARDITTKVFGDELVTPFLKVINEKYLGDLNRWVHNTGRYYNGYSDVRVDTLPELITTKDALAGQVIKESNDVLEKLIDTYADNNLSLDIPILVSRPGQKTISERSGERFVSRTYNFVYDNYFYGTKASTITSAAQCSLIRGTSFGGRNTTVETNHGYDVSGAQEDTKIITADANAGIKCTSPTQSYWGGNSPMNATYKNGEMLLGSNRYDDFSLPVLDLGAGKKTTGVNSPLDCLRNDLILRPYQHNGLENRRYLWPTETGGVRYSCATPLQSPTPNPFSLDPTPENSENILSALTGCAGNSGNITLLNRDGGSLGLCQANGLSGTYKRIPSLVKHSDPTTAVYGQQLQGDTTPNLPIDEERYLLYIDRTGAQARIDYPNLFDINVEIDDTDDEILTKIRRTLDAAQSRLTPAVTFASNHRWSQLVKTPTSAVNLTDVLLANNDIKTGLIDALRWKHLDIEMKYSEVLKKALTPTSNKLLLPNKKDLYEISYLGGQGDAQNFVFGFSPEEKSDLPEWFTDIQEAHGDVVTTLGTFSENSNPEYSLSSSEIAELLGESSSSSGDTSSGEETGSESGGGASESSSSECGDPTGVVIWEWLSAIQCWLSEVMKTEWFTPDIDDIGFPELPSLTVSFGGDIIWSTKELQNVDQTDSNDNDVIDYVEKNSSSLTLTNTLSSATIEPTQSLRIDAALESSTYRINDDVTRIDLEVIRIDDLDEGKSYSARDTGWEEIQNRYFSVSGGNTLRDGHAVWIFTSKNNHRTRITFESRIYSGTNVLIRSEKSSVLIGPINLGLTVLSTSGSTTSETITAGDVNGINVLLSGLDEYPTTADITFRDYITGEQKGFYKAVPISNGKIRLGSPAVDPVLKRASRYTMTAVVGDYSGKTNFTIAPDKAHALGITLDPLLIRDTPISMPVVIRDIWGNSINTSDWNLEIKSSNNILLAPLSSKATQSVSGKFSSPLTLIPLEAGNTTLTFTASKGTEKITASIARPVLSDALIVVDIPGRNNLEVGQEVPVNFTIQRQDGSIIEDWNMSVKIGVSGGNAKINQENLTFSKGRASTLMTTGTRTGIAAIYLKDTGLGKVIGESFTILPGVPTSLALSAPETIHAKVGAQDTLRAYLYDPFGNLTTLHGYSLKIESDKPQLLSGILTPVQLSTGVFETNLTSTGLPGRILFRAWLEKDGKKSSVSTLESAAQTNALPVITSEEASNNAWQNITQVLLGAAFGQSPIQGYFGGSTLFSSSTKTLALSTLVDTPQNPIFTVTPSGNVVTGNIQYGTGVEAQIESYLDGVLTIIVYDTRLGGIARIRYPAISPDTSFVACTNSCDRDLMYFVPDNSEITYKDGKVFRNNQQLFALRDIFTFPNLSFGFIHQTGENLQFTVSYNGALLGTLSLRWKSRVPVEQGSTQTSNTFTLEPLRSTLSTKLAWSNKSSYETPSLIMYNTSDSTSYLGGAHDRGWSSYPKQFGLGWTHDNTSLLQFAAGQEWSSSIRDNADYLTINLGDPIIDLPNYQVNGVTGLDQTIGEPVYMGTTDIDDFTFRDANSDGEKDLIVYHPDGTVGMGLSRGDGFMIDVGDLLSVRAAQQDMVRAGDFVGDGYADIVYVDEEGILHQVVHTAGGPMEKPMQYDKAPLLGQIEQLEVFDMDHDGVDDIIVMDHLGSLYIFYGHSSGIFRVQLIENVYDFVLSDEAKSSYFTGAISYNGLGFVDPDNIAKASTFELQSKQDQVNQMIFTQIRIAKTGSSVTVPTVGTTVVNTLDVDSNGLLRMYDGDATTLSSSLQFGYDAVGDTAGETVTVSSGDQTYDTFDLLRAPFIIPGYLSVTKKYRSLEESGQVLSGSPIEVTLTLKNVSKQNMSNILLLEKFADYLSVSDMSYSLLRGTTKETRTFIADSSQSNAGIADLRGITLTPGSSLTIVYTGTLRSFSFGRFDVGYLEDKDDPTSNTSIPADKIRTINESALKLASIPEKDFYNHDVYGDIRFNPNETCGGPVLLWRSHNSYDRTYHKTVIVREVTNPDENASELGTDPANTLTNTSNSNSSAVSESFDIESTLTESESTMETWESDSDADSIPDKDDDDHGDVFEISSSGNTTQISIGLGKIDETVDEITEGVKDILSGLSCGFGDPGCISMPINWAPNAPGNTITLMGYAIPGANTPPVACHKSVLCGTPVFAYPTDCCSSSNYWDLIVCEAGGGDSVNTCTWPSAPEGAGGLLDYIYMNNQDSGNSNSGNSNGLNDSPDASGTSTGQTAPTYEKGLGISDYRLWITPTLTGAIAEVMCFGKNNSQTMNPPGLFPLRFDGNCIFATQPLFQCEDDGSDDEPLVMELDISDELSGEMDDSGDDGSGNGNGNQFTNADECSFFEPVTSYPTDLASATDAYFKQTNDTTVSALQNSIADNADIVNETQSTDTALEFSTTSPSSAYERLNGQNGLEYEMTNGTGMIQIALDPSAMKFKDFGKVLDINLKSIKGFPNFIMDWYQRQMDEIMSSLTHLPDIKIFLPDLSSLADSGWMSSFGSGMKQQLGNIISSPSASTGPAGSNTNGSNSTNGDYYNAQDKSNNCGATACSIAASKLTGANAQQLEQQFTAQDPGGMSWSSPEKWLSPLGLNVDQRSSMTSSEINSQVQSGNVVLTSVTPQSGLTNGGHITAITGSQQSGNGYVFQNSDPNYNNIQKGYGTISDSRLSNGGAKQFWVVSNNSTSGSTNNSGGFISNTASTVKSGWNSAFSGVNSGLNQLSSGVGTVLGGAETAADTVSSAVQQKAAGIQNAFEYLGTLPIIDVHPETISFDIPWVGKQEAQAWIARNQAILDAWRKLPADAANSVYVGPLIASIESNIETVRSYFELPERLQTLFYLKEKLLYGILQNVKAIQDLMGGWLYENGQRFKGWVEAFILITKLFDLWQVLLDVFNDYEVECGECRNERWNLQHWLWIVISAIIPPIPIIQMPRWPDIELDFSDIDLSLDIAYPVFDLNFYPVSLPDAPAPTISGFPLDPMPQLPQIPDLNIDFEIPVIQLPNLPDLPPPPKIPELSQAIEVVLDIFKLLVLIQCLYRKIPLSPEWVVGTKVAHKTERQGYLPFDFLDSRLPTVTMEWLEAIRVSTHVKLEYDVDFIIDVLKEALEPFTNFPKNLGQTSSGGSNTVDFNINPDSGVEVQASSAFISEDSIARIPELIRTLFVATSAVQYADPQVALDSITSMTQRLDISPLRKKQLSGIFESQQVAVNDFSSIQNKLDNRFAQIAQAVQMDVEENRKDIDDLIAWNGGQKKPEDIPFIAQNIPGSIHLAESSQKMGHLLALSPNITRPILPLNFAVPNILAPLSAPVAVAPTPDVVAAPGEGSSFENMVESEGLTKTQGLYVTNGTTTHRLIDYTENLDGNTKIHTVDDDGDGDLDVYYSLGSTIYRKENYTKTPSQYFIKDAPKVYTTLDIYEDFFGVENVSDIPSEGQIDILQNHSANRIRYQTLMKNPEGHTRLRLFRSLFETDASKAKYQIDIIPESKTTSTTHTVQNVPRILDIDGLVFIEHNKTYRTLLTGQKFINEEGREEYLSDDFVIRSGQSGYTSESTTLDVTTNGKTTEKKMVVGQQITFSGDSRVKVKKGSLILFGNTTEKRPLTIRDTHMPLLPGDIVITDKNSGATLKFPDGTETELGASQYWTLSEYAPGIGVKKLSLPVEAEWYYGNIMDARTLTENRLPHATVFDAYTDFSESDAISQIPRQITLSLPGPTEIDFQSYFPADTLTNVEIFRLPSSEWRRVTSTKIAFESQKETREILVRVTTSGRVRDYTTRIVTAPPKLSINTVDQTGVFLGNVSSSANSLPMGIQSFIDNQSWTLVNNSQSNSGVFSGSLTRNATKLSIQQGTTPVVTFDRATTVPTGAPTTMRLAPSITLGKTLGYSLYDGTQERLKVSYQGQNVAYKQVANYDEINTAGIFIIGSNIRLEPATLTDVNLKGGVYITDSSYRPLITLDNSGIVKTLDPNISWSVKIENNRVVFILLRDRLELGKIVLAGEMITYWSK